jgi:hypothetical protein
MFKMNYLKREGQGSSATGLAQWKNGSWRWAGVKRDEMGERKGD